MENVFVTQTELTAERAPGELTDWVAWKFREIAQRAGGKEAVRMRQGLCKQLVEEVYPLSIFACLRFGVSENVTLQPIIGNQNYDALVIDHSSSPPRTSKLEITQAHEGEPEYLRRLMLQEQRWAPASGQIEKSGTKNTGIKLTTNLVAKRVEDLLNEQIVLIRDALDRKLSKKYESDTSLLIMFEDVVAFDEEDQRQELYRVVRDELGPKAEPFVALYLASWSKRIFLAWTHD